MYEVLIGLEIHLQLDTQSKMFCGCANREVIEPNVDVCPVCLGHPGTLPMLNNSAVRHAALLALALNCEILLHSKFDRKNYFYPDLPKGYQISQFDVPLARDGFLDIYPDERHPKNIHIERIHLEEDAARMKHVPDGDSLVDFQRAGAPLAEIVTRPDFRNPQEAKIFLQDLQQIVRYLGISSADMEKGQMRCDANISLRPKGDSAMYPKTEVKNMNSFRSVERALTHEQERLTNLWEKGAAPEMTTTRGWDDRREVTVPQRSKEGTSDYRFFPEPDLPPLALTMEFLNALRLHLPEMPAARRIRFQDEYVLSFHDAKTITQDPRIADFYEATMSELRVWAQQTESLEGTEEERWNSAREKLTRLAFSWITSKLFALLRSQGVMIDRLPMTAENFAELLIMIVEKRLHSSAAMEVLRWMVEHGGDPSVIAREHRLEPQTSEEDIAAIVDRIIGQHPEAVEEIRQGKTKVIMFLVGKLMKETKGRVDPERARELFHEKLRA